MLPRNWLHPDRLSKSDCELITSDWPSPFPQVEEGDGLVEVVVGGGGGEGVVDGGGGR
jgi:hypothetical protein